MDATLFERLGTKISLTTAGRIFAEYAEQILDLRRRAQDSINELERVPRGELVIAANEATCIYVLPGVFAEYKKKFPNVQLSVDRSYGSRVVEAVMDNLADFGITQLPVQEKKLQVVRIHSDEIILLLPGQTSAGAPAPGNAARPDGPAAAAAQVRHHAHPPGRLAGTGGRAKSRSSMELDSTEMIKRFVMAGLGYLFPGRLQLPGRGRRRQAGGGFAGPGTDGSQGGLDLSQGQSAFQSRSGVHSGYIGTCGE